MKDIKVSDQPRMLNELAEALGQASGGCSQLIHQMNGDPRWMILRQAIDLSREGIMQLATFHASKITPVKPL